MRVFFTAGCAYFHLIFVFLTENFIYVVNRDSVFGFSNYLTIFVHEIPVTSTLWIPNNQKTEVLSPKIFFIIQRCSARQEIGFHQQPFSPCFRLAFHDCIGGCDGCINLQQTENNGLADIVGQLEEVYSRNKLKKLISR